MAGGSWCQECFVGQRRQLSGIGLDKGASGRLGEPAVGADQRCAALGQLGVAVWAVLRPVEQADDADCTWTALDAERGEEAAEQQVGIEGEGKVGQGLLRPGCHSDEYPRRTVFRALAALLFTNAVVRHLDRDPCVSNLLREPLYACPDVGEPRCVNLVTNHRDQYHGILLDGVMPKPD